MWNFECCEKSGKKKRKKEKYGISLKFYMQSILESHFTPTAYSMQHKSQFSLTAESFLME